MSEQEPTLLQFAGAASAISVRVCPRCSQAFSDDARFCPFDGEPLSGETQRDLSGDPLLGSVVDDRYVVEALLGEGGMGRVYRAHHRALGRRLALKVLKAELASDAVLAARFIQEAKAVAAVDHPAVVQVTDFGVLPTGQPYFVMELLEGVSLSSLIRDFGPLEPSEAVKIARRTAEGLGAAHAADVVHRDLKPENIHVEGLGTGRVVVKVLDFGLAKIGGQSRLTQAGVVYGTPHYMSPEQAVGGELDHRVDVYALGVVMFEMITGRTPFDAASCADVLNRHIHDKPVAPSSLVGRGKLAKLDRVILRCLEKLPEQRYQAMAELLAALERVEPGTGPCAPRQVGATDTLPGGDDQERKSFADALGLPVTSRWPIAWGGMAGLALFAAGLIFLASPEGEADTVPTPPGRVPEATHAGGARSTRQPLGAQAPNRGGAAMPIAPGRAQGLAGAGRGRAASASGRAATGTPSGRHGASPPASAPGEQQQTVKASPGGTGSSAAAPPLPAASLGAPDRRATPPVAPTARPSSVRQPKVRSVEAGEIIDPWAQ